MGRRYLAFAAEDPLGYRLMFGTPWPALAEELGLVHDARHALDVLSTMLRRIHGNDRAMRTPVDRGALFIWLQMRGLASIAQANVMQHLGMTLQAGRQMVWHATNVLELGW